MSYRWSTWAAGLRRDTREFITDKLATRDFIQLFLNQQESIADEVMLQTVKIVTSNWGKFAEFFSHVFIIILKM